MKEFTESSEVSSCLIQCQRFSGLGDVLDVCIIFIIGQWEVFIYFKCCTLVILGTFIQYRMNFRRQTHTFLAGMTIKINPKLIVILKELQQGGGTHLYQNKIKTL